MKDFRKNGLRGGILLSALACTPMLQASTLTPSITLHHQQVSQVQVDIELGVENISDEVIALEISIEADDIQNVLEVQSKVANSYMTYQVLDAGNGKEKLICYIVSQDKEMPITTVDGGLSVAQIGLKTSGKVTIHQDAVSIKTIELGYETNQYDKVQLQYTEGAYTPEDSKEDDENQGGEGDNTPNQGGDTDNDSNQGGESNNNQNQDGVENETAKPGAGNNPSTGNNQSTGNSSGNSHNKPIQDTTNNAQNDHVGENNLAISFTDLENHWAKSAIEKMASRGIIKGYEDGSFKPSASITRGEFATLLARAFEMKQTSLEHPFKDVASDKWYTEGIVALYEMGITSGRADGTFGVHDAITNEEMSTMLYRTLSALQLEIQTQNELSDAFVDHTQISPYAKEAVQQLKQMGIISGTPDGKFNPKGFTSRAQVAVMLERIFNCIEL